MPGDGIKIILVELQSFTENIKGYRNLSLLRWAMERDDEKQILADVA